MERKLSPKRVSEWLGVLLIAVLMVVLLSSLLLSKLNEHDTGVLLLSLFLKIATFAIPMGASFLLVRAGYCFPEMKKTFSGYQTILIIISSIGSIVCVQMLYGSVFPMTINTLGITSETKPLTLALLFFGYVVAPALLEEIFFRGILMRSLTMFRGLLAILISSLAFALMHVSLFSFPLVFVCGFIIGTAYLSTGSLAATVVIHLSCNAFWYFSAVLGAFVPSHALMLMQGLFGACVLMLAAGLPLLKMTFVALFDDDDKLAHPSSSFWTAPMILFFALALAANILLGG